MIAQFAGVTSPRPTRSGARSATSRGWPRPSCGSSRGRWRRGYSAAGGRADLEGARGVRVVRLLQGARRGVRAADLPVGLAQGALPGALPVRGAHPRPGDVPQAADPRRRPPARHRDPRPRRQRQRETYVVERSLDDAAVGRRDAGTAATAALRHPAGAGRGEGDQRRPRSTGSSPPGRSTRSPTSGTAPGSPGRSSSGWCWPAASTRSTASGSPGGVRRRGTVTRRDLLLQVAELDRHARADRPGRPGPRAGRATGGARRSGRPRTPWPRTPPSRNSTDAVGPARAPRRAGAARRSASAGVWARAAAQSQATADARRRSTSVQLTLDLGDAPARGRGDRAARDGRPRSGCAPSSRSSASTPAGTSSTSTPSSSTRSASPAASDLLRQAQQGRAAGRRGQGRHPDPADPVRAPGRLPDPRRRHRPGRRDVLRGRPGSLRRHRLPLLAAGGPRRAAPHRPPRRLAARHRLLGAARCWPRSGSAPASTRCASRWPWSPRGSAAWASTTPSPGRPRVAVHPAGDGQPAELGDAPRRSRPRHRRRHGPAPGAGALQRVPDVALRRHQAGRRGHPASVARKLWHRSPGSAG